MIAQDDNPYANINTPEYNLTKYWWYRYRMWNYFMVLSTDLSEDGVFNVFKNIGPDKVAKQFRLQIHDGTIELGWYIALLATEYKLFEISGQEQAAETTLKELACAIGKVYQLDHKAEGLFGCPDYDTDRYYENPNGFFCRDDVPADFLSRHKDYFPFGEAIDDCSDRWYWDNYFDKNPDENPSEWSKDIGVRSVWSDVKDGTGNCENAEFERNGACGEGDKKGMCGEISQDQCWNLFVGFALVDELVGDVSVESPCHGREVVIGDMVEVITHHIVKYMKKSSGVDRWKLINPCTGEAACPGGNIARLAYDFGEAAREICGDHFPNYWFQNYYSRTFRIVGRWFNAGFIDWWVKNICEHPRIDKNCKDGFNYMCLRTVSGDESFKDTKKYVETYDKYPRFPLIYKMLHGNLENNGDWSPDDLNNMYNFNNHWKEGYIKDIGKTASENFMGKTSSLQSFMVLHNLYYLAASKYFIPFLKMEHGNYTLDDLDFPYEIPDNKYRGDQSNPIVLEAFNKIEASNTIENTGNVTYKAGKEIVLKPGFHAKAGSNFHAKTDDYLYDCTTNMTHYWDDYCSNNLKSTTLAQQMLKSKTINPHERYTNDSLSGEKNEQSNNIIDDIQLTIYPNPSKGVFTITTDIASAMDVSVFMADGTHIYSKKYYKSTFEIDLSGHPKGVYFVKIIFSEGIINRKIIIY